MSSAPPILFAPKRRIAARRRMLLLQQQAGAPRYLIDDMIEDVRERLAFLRHEPETALIVGDWTGELGEALRADGCEVAVGEPAEGFDPELPFADGQYHPAVSLGVLDAVNDLPGTLIHTRTALRPGGLMVAEFVGAGSLLTLRAAMLAADGERPAPRLHPQVDVRAGGQLLQRAGIGDPVIDTRTLAVSFRSLDALVADLRAMGLSNLLADPGPPLGKATLERARAAFQQGADEAGRVVESFEILTLSGWRK